MVSQPNFLGRTFQLWEYRVSHGSLLIRSPKDQGNAKNIDVICVGLEYVSMPRFLTNLDIVGPTDVELRQIEEILGKPLPVSFVRIFVANGRRFPVVASRVKIVENETDIFDSPFDEE